MKSQNYKNNLNLMKENNNEITFSSKKNSEIAKIPTINCESIETYKNTIKKIPLLSKEKEQILSKAVFQNGDIKAAQELILSHLRFVAHISKKYSGYGLQEADIIQEGNIGLMKATKRFNPEFGVRFTTYAVHWIKAEIHEYVLNNWKIVKMATTKAQRKLFFNLRKNKKQLAWFSNNEITNVAQKLDVKERDVIEMESRLGNQDQSFEYDSSDNNEALNESNYSPSLYLEDLNSNIAHNIEIENSEKVKRLQLNQGIDSLDKRSQEIIKHRWLNEKKMTLKGLADMYQVSAERIRQIESNAFIKLRGAMAA